MALPPLVDQRWFLFRPPASDGAASTVTVVDLAHMVVIGAGAATLKTALREACARPATGKPRRPRVVVVATERDLAEVKGAMPGVAVEVAEPPEALISAVHARDQRVAASGGKRTLGWAPDLMTELLDLSLELLDLSPWSFVDDTQSIEVHAPDLGIEAGELVVLGAAGRQYGFMLFPDAATAARFRAVARLIEAGHAEALDDTDVGSYLTLNLDLPDDLPYELVAAAHRAGYREELYPLPVRVTPTEVKVAGPLELRKLVLVGQALCELVVEHEDALEAGTPASIEEEGVRLVYRGLQGAAHSPVPAAAPPPEGSAAHWRVDDFALLERLTDLADELLPASWREPIDADDADDPDAPLVVTALELWPTLLGGPLGATTPLAELRRLRPEAFDARAEAILAAQAVAWTGLWEVHSLVPGRGFSARDLLTHEERFISDVAASQSVRERSILCARVVTIGEDSWLAAGAEHAIAPREADELRRIVCEHFDWPKTKAVPLAKVLAPRAQRQLAGLWRDHIEALFARPLPDIATPQGEDVRVVEDHYALADADLSRIPNAEPPEAPGDPWFLRSGEGPFLKSDMHVERGALRVVSLTSEQADRARNQLEATFGRALRHLERSTERIQDRARQSPPSPSTAPTEEMQRAVAAFKAKHYASWPDVALPALDGKTPRQAIATKRGRAQVERLLADLEHHEQAVPPAARYDVDILRTALGLPPSRVHPGVPRH